MTDTKHVLTRTVHYVTEARETRWSDDGRPFEGDRWFTTPDHYTAHCSCGTSVRSDTEANAREAHRTHAHFAAIEDAKAVTR